MPGGILRYTQAADVRGHGEAYKEVGVVAYVRIRNTGEEIHGEDQVREFLNRNEVYYDHWDVDRRLPDALKGKFDLSDAEKDEILQALQEEIQDLSRKRGYVKWDVISLSESTPNLDELLKKFEQVHTHTEDEVRAIVSGSGIFIIKGKDGGYFDVVLSAGDVISVPEGNPHFFTLTDERKVVAVRLFIDPAGWVAHPYEDPAFQQA
ncbi:Acireductone dioxygenase ARD [Alicyclobacillus acidocaldarius subsp. acidocaldarius Tc-4-1]|uniref:Acireductone dioxygenase n=1 Tax=Alicyclobacillus acidocaldarius (strain Tc-4-1) TaxID=1048834 RepID=F8IID4_ALIAT|nr:Acireductone dioxygenase ARD [Alicyclobacillus acidocaldarius subsp. acidocaldarius Tc-4-1]